MSQVCPFIAGDISSSRKVLRQNRGVNNINTLLRIVCRTEGTGDIHEETSKPKKIPAELLSEHVYALHHLSPCDKRSMVQSLGARCSNYKINFKYKEKSSILIEKSRI